MSRHVFSLFSLVSIFLISGFASAEESKVDTTEVIEKTIAKARKYLGGDEALKKIKTISYKGVVIYGTGQSGTIESVYKQPSYHQTTSVIGKIKETSTLNKTEGWQKVESVDAPGAWSLDLYTVDDLKHMQASVASKLGFLSKPNTISGRIEYLGTKELDGKSVQVLQYFYTSTIWFRHYIDDETGRVLYTLNDKGFIFKETGEKVVEGVRFPEKIVVSAGSEKMEISFSEIKVNQPIDNDRFNVPVMAN